MDRKRWNLAHGRITVSTVGLISQIRKLTKELPEVSLALSLHAANQAARTAIVPTATRYPIDQLIDALDNHMMAYLTKSVGESYTDEERIKEGTRRRAMIEYVMRTYNLQNCRSSFRYSTQQTYLTPRSSCLARFSGRGNFIIASCASTWQAL